MEKNFEYFDNLEKQMFDPAKEREKDRQEGHISPEKLREIDKQLEEINQKKEGGEAMRRFDRQARTLAGLMGSREGGKISKKLAVLLFGLVVGLGYVGYTLYSLRGLGEAIKGGVHEACEDFGRTVVKGLIGEKAVKEIFEGKSSRGTYSREPSSPPFPSVIEEGKEEESSPTPSAPPPSPPRKEKTRGYDPRVRQE